MNKDIIKNMADLIDYVSWRGDLTFRQSPFCTVDALILCQISYIYLDPFLSGRFDQAKTLSQVSKEFYASPDFNVISNMGALINAKSVDLLKVCGNSERFGNMKLSGYVSKFDGNPDNAEQFAALAFVQDKIKFLAFRGTDDTIIGWKEDFNLAYMPQIPSQKDALKYIKDAADFFRGDLMLGGHSKGGHLALYAAINSDKKIKKRIEKVYNFDGPGFASKVFVSDEYREIKDRVVTVYPQLDVVGMLFHHPDKFIITESNEFAVMQHDAFSWSIKNTGFVEKSDFTEESKFFYATFNHWIAELEPEQIKDFIDTLFGCVLSSGCTTNREIEENKLQNSAKILFALNHDVESEKREQIMEIIHLFMKVVKGNIPMFSIFRNVEDLGLGKIKENITKGIEELGEKLKR